MHRTIFEEEYEQKRNSGRLFTYGEPPKKLSPIPEHQESIASPQPKARSTEFDSPLPELIIEPVRYEYEDESDEFYDRLEIRMKMFYRKIFLEKDFDIDDIFNDIPDYSIYERYSNEGVDEGSVGDDVSTLHIQSEGEVQESPDAGPGQSSENGNGKSYASREETDVTDSEDSHTLPEVANKSEQIPEKFAGIRGDNYLIYSISSSDENCNKIEDVVPSQTFTEKLGPSQESSSTKSKAKSESEDVVVEKITERAIVHFVERNIVHDRELEVMRREKTPSFEDSYIQRRSSNNEKIDLNIGRYSLEEERSCINTSEAMEIDSFVHPSIISTPLKEVSPVLPFKRPASELPTVAAKKKKTNKFEEISHRNKETDNITKEIDQRRIVREKELQVNIPLIDEDAIAQKKSQDRRDAGTQMCTDYKAASIQTDEEPIWIECRNVGCQTEEREMRDESTQTQLSFEYYRLFDGINFFFIF